MIRHPASYPNREAEVHGEGWPYHQCRTYRSQPAYQSRCHVFPSSILYQVRFAHLDSSEKVHLFWFRQMTWGISPIMGLIRHGAHKMHHPADAPEQRYPSHAAPPHRELDNAPARLQLPSSDGHGAADRQGGVCSGVRLSIQPVLIRIHVRTYNITITGSHRGYNNIQMPRHACLPNKAQQAHPQIPYPWPMDRRQPPMQ